MEEDTVAEQLDDAAAVSGGDLAHQLGEAQGHVGGGLVAGLLGQTGVARHVRERRRLGPSKRTPPDAGVIERGLDVVDLVGGHEHLRVTPEEPADEVLAAAPDTSPDVAEGRLVRLVVAEAPLPEGRFDGRVEVMRQVLRDAARALAQHPGHPKKAVLSDTCLGHDGERPEDREVLLAHQLARLRAAEAERDVEALDRLDRDSDLVAGLRVRHR